MSTSHTPGRVGVTYHLRVARDEEEQQDLLKYHDSEGPQTQAEAPKERTATEKRLEESNKENIDTKRSMDEELDTRHRPRAQLSDAEIAHCQTKKAKYVEKLRRDLQQASQVDHIIKQLLSEEKNKDENATKLKKAKRGRVRK